MTYNVFGGTLNVAQSQSVHTFKVTFKTASDADFLVGYGIMDMAEEKGRDSQLPKINGIPTF